jgi:hypothetical protein
MQVAGLNVLPFEICVSSSLELSFDMIGILDFICWIHNSRCSAVLPCWVGSWSVALHLVRFEVWVLPKDPNPLLSVRYSTWVLTSEWPYPWGHQGHQSWPHKLVLSAGRWTWWYLFSYIGVAAALKWNSCQLCSFVLRFDSCGCAFWAMFTHASGILSMPILHSLFLYYCNEVD